MSIDIAIEMGGSGPGYGKIHKVGCRDLRDPLPLGAASTREEANELADRATGWEQFAEIGDSYPLAPCVKFPKS